MGMRLHIPQEEYLNGLGKVVSKIQDAVDKIVNGSAQGLMDAAMYIAAESQPRAPVDMGDLRGSVEVRIDNNIVAMGVKGNDSIVTVCVPPEMAAKAEVSYNTKYAADQHEQILYNHPRGGQAKYLESVLLENSDRILGLIAGKVGDELFGG